MEEKNGGYDESTKKWWSGIMNHQRFRQYWQSLGVVLTIDMVLRIMLGALRVINTPLLIGADVPFVSLTNIKRIMVMHPLILGGVVLELGLIAWALIILLAALMIGLTTVADGQDWTQGWHQLGRAIRQVRLKTFGLLIVDFVVLTPLFSVAFRTPLLTALRIPEFLLDYGTRKWWLTVVAILVYAICWPLAIRYLYVWSLTNVDGLSLHQAMLQSVTRTRHGRWKTPVGQLATVLVSAGVLSWLVNGFLYGLQLWFQPNNRWFSTGCLVIAETVATMLCSWVLMKWTNILVQDNDVVVARSVMSGWTGMVLLGIVINAGLVSSQYFQLSRLPIPATIAHRGVANRNGVQNTIAVLKRTSRQYHPDYVEMDIHETRDHQFVVMHDENLRKLAGINKRPGQLTLHQLQHITIRENGQRAPIASFDNYLAAAQHLHQKLIVELKTTQYDSPDVVRRFNRQYGRIMVKRHHIVHSLDYRVVHQLHDYNPRMKVLYLQAYNFTNPVTTVTGYNNEYSTLNGRFISAAHRHHQPVYAWTVNNQGAMRQLYDQQVNGIVTDRLPELQTTLRQARHHQDRAHRYWNFLDPIANCPDFVKWMR